MNSNDMANLYDLINLLSLVVGMQNLQENREQSAQNDVQQANSQQAEFLLRELGKKFDEQNDMLKRILELLEKDGKGIDKVNTV